MMTPMTSIVVAPPPAPPATTQGHGHGPDAWLTIDEVVEESRFSRSTVERAMRRYRDNPTTGLQHSKQAGALTGGVRIRRRWMDAWIARRAPESAQSAKGVPARSRTRQAVS